MARETGPKDPVTTPPTPAPLPALTPAPGVRVALDVRGWALVALPDRVVVLDDDLRHLRAFDASTGAQLWRVEAQKEPRGRHTLYAVGDRVLLHAGSDLVAVDARTGQLVATHPARAYNGGGDSCRLEIRRGFTDVYREWVADDPASTTCAAVCECTVRLFRCDTGAPIAEPFNGSDIHIHDDFQQSYDVLCVGPPRLLGRHNGRYLLGVDRKDRKSEGYDAIAVDDAGKELWRQPQLSAAMQRYREVGGDAATDLCWSVDDDSMVAWTCSTGQVKWRAAFADKLDPFSNLARLVAPGRLLVRRRTDVALHVELRELATGKRLWRRELPPDRAAIAPGEATDVLVYASTTTYAWLDLRSGATLREAPLTKDQALVLDPAGDGYLRLGGPEVAELARDGRPLRAVPKDIPEVDWVGARFLTGREGPRFTVYRRPDLEVALTVAGNWAAERSSLALGPAGVLLYEHRGADEPLRIVVLRAD
nr:PQQ-binding-like beta-propeller repeat protein [Nannocystis sp. SCPEA4]